MRQTLQDSEVNNRKELLLFFLSVYICYRFCLHVSTFLGSSVCECFEFYPPADHPRADSFSVRRRACSNQTLEQETREWCCEDETQMLQANCSHLQNQKKKQGIKLMTPTPSFISKGSTIGHVPKRINFLCF